MIDISIYTGRREGVKGGVGGYPEVYERLFSQAEVDGLVAGKLEGFTGVDVEEYRALKVAKAQQERVALEKQGDFEKILAQTVKVCD